MKSKFGWYFSPTEEEIRKIWDGGILTVDANVLLDLYRYHDSTRNSLISSIKRFGGRLWLSNQAAEEFIRNRAKAIISSEKTFKQANEDVEKLKNNLESSVVQLKGNRIIPAKVADGLLAVIEPAINQAIKEIEEAKSSYPKYLQDDPILENVSQMFSDSIGKEFNEDELKIHKEEAENRKKNEIPPGYLDKDKDGDRPYGDYFMWK